MNGINKHNLSKWTYPDLDLAKQPVVHLFKINFLSFIYLEKLLKKMNPLFQLLAVLMGKVRVILKEPYQLHKFLVSRRFIASWDS